MGTAKVAMQIFWFTIKIELNYQKQTNFNSKVVPRKLDVSTANAKAMVAMQMFKICCPITSIKNYWGWIDATIIVAIFIPSCQVHDLASSDHINKPVVKSNHHISRIEKNPVPFISLQEHETFFISSWFRFDHKYVICFILSRKLSFRNLFLSLS